MKNITTYILIGFITLLMVFAIYDHTELLAIKSNQNSIIKPAIERIVVLEKNDKIFKQDLDEVITEQTNQFISLTDELKAEMNGYGAEIKAIKVANAEVNTKSDQLGSKFAEAIKNLGGIKNYDKEITSLRQSIEAINQKLQ